MKFFFRKIASASIRKLSFKQKAFLVRTVRENLSLSEKNLLFSQNNVFLSLSYLLKYDYKPSYIIDVGAYVGEWTKEAYKIFPGTSFVAVEPLPDKKIILEKAFTGMPVKLYNNLVGNERRQNVKFHSMETGSSVFEELGNLKRDTIFLDMITLDDIADQENLNGSILLKLDVQGFELEVLKGAEKLLKNVDVICMEVSFLNYNNGAPLAHEVIQRLQELNYYIYDIPAFTRKADDFALVQADIIFLKSGCGLRNKINNIKDGVNLIFSA